MRLAAAAILLLLGIAPAAVADQGDDGWIAACRDWLVLHDSDWIENSFPRDPADKRKRVVPPGTVVDVNPHPKDIARDLDGATRLIVSRTDDRKLAAFPAVPTLEEFVVWSSSVESLAFAANYPALRRLGVSASKKIVQLREVGTTIRALGLTALALDGTTVAGAILAEDARTLRLLNLRATRFALVGQIDLSGFAGLECLSFAAQQGPTALVLPAAGALRYLDLGGSDLRLVQGLDGLGTVEVLILNEAKGLDGFRLPLGPDSRLRHLSLASADLAGLLGLADAGTLQVLNLAEASNLPELPTSLPVMLSFEAQGTGWTGFDRLDAPNLVHLGIDVALVADLATLDRFPKLASIELGAAPADPALIRRLAERGLHRILGIFESNDGLQAIQNIEGYELCWFNLSGRFAIAKAGEPCPAWLSSSVP